MPEDQTTAPVRRQRPKDRKQQIAENAGRLFVSNGFHAVRMEDIASASGITVRALYRHYAHKQALLSYVVHAGQARYLAAIRQSSGAGAPLEGLLHGLATAALDSRDLTLLWQREARHLDPEDHDEVRRVLVRIAADVSAAVQDHREDLPSDSVRLRAWAVLGVLAAPGQYRASLRRPDFDTLLAAACRAAVEAPAGARATARQVTPGPLRMLGSRREQLLASAAQAFRGCGFVGVGIDDIGAGPGVAGPALYRYFDSKAEILAALVVRLEEWLALESLRALRSADSDAEVLRALVAGYVRVVLDAPDMAAVAVSEALHLPDETRNRLHRLRQDREVEWTRWLGIHRPGLPATTGRMLAALAVSVVNDMVRAPQSLNVQAKADELVDIALAIMLDTGVASDPEPRQRKAGA
ncbi:TetR/AcrR family transcriptional regulator [Peterkaempfera sp. SMS 1(5)a]|uniref:TetR/AcrR family transcriptional regulator n=1 Tax=Peterkaempfera podocarpi TaxID=3232308 RepID=UPI00366BFDDE